MSDVVIRVENLYKEYRLGTISHGTLYRDLQSWWARMRGKEDPNSIIVSPQSFTPHASHFTSPENPHMLALNDVSFEVKRGEVLGIIGKNGAGKSTLLKILSEVTSPTKGQVKIKGRVASLLEVGTGFHPELTGRENIYLNGAILGMTKQEITQKFDEIVAFAEVEKFIDTPVKRYSSGMYVRLAFSVAAHLEPEILIVDEVLAVGDAAFQKKCLGKMGEVAEGGRTVLFVSHNMSSIEHLCKRVIWLDRGRILKDGDSKKTVADYIDEMNKYVEIREVGQYQNFGHRRGTGEIVFTEFRLINTKGAQTKSFVMGEAIRMEVDFMTMKNVDYAIFSFGLIDSLTQIAVTNWTANQNPQKLMKGEKGRFSVVLQNNPLRARKYYFYLGIVGNNDIPYDIWDGIGTEFSVTYPRDVSSLEFSIGRDVAIVTLPVTAEIQKRVI